MDYNILTQMVEDKITVENLETIRTEEREDPGGMENAKSKILAALESASYSFRDLRRKTRIKGSRLDRVLAELEAENRVKIIEVKQSTGPAARMISLNRPIDNSPEARQRRINALGMGMYKSNDWS
jgi:hypothetical protein